MANPPKVRLPNNRQRIAVLGRTGSGKTLAAGWHLSTKDLARDKWVAIDFKHDELIGAIEGARHIDFEDPMRHPGLYVLRPLPHEIERVDKFLWEKVWQPGGIGVWCDEGYMFQDTPGFEACLFQGRSKRIPMIVLAQRPAWISRFVFSEADFYQFFALNDLRDKKTVANLVPALYKAERLPDYHSYYYDVAKDNLVVMQPVPSKDEIIEKIDSKLIKKKRAWL